MIGGVLLGGVVVCGNSFGMAAIQDPIAGEPVSVSVVVDGNQLDILIEAHQVRARIDGQDCSKDVLQAEQRCYVMRSGEKLLMIDFNPDVSSFAAEENRRKVIGVQLDSVGEALASQLGVDASGSLLVVSLSDGLPAQHAGVQRHDVLVALNGRPATMSVLQEELARPAAHPLQLELLRKGERHTLSIAPAVELAGSASPVQLEHLAALGYIAVADGELLQVRGGDKNGLVATAARTKGTETGLQDIDGDGDPDLFLTGRVTDGFLEARTYRMGAGLETLDQRRSVRLSPGKYEVRAGSVRLESGQLIATGGVYLQLERSLEDGAADSSKESPEATDPSGAVGTGLDAEAQAASAILERRLAELEARLDRIEILLKKLVK